MKTSGAFYHKIQHYIKNMSQDRLLRASIDDLKSEILHLPNTQELSTIYYQSILEKSVKIYKIQENGTSASKEELQRWIKGATCIGIEFSEEQIALFNKNNRLNFQITTTTEDIENTYVFIDSIDLGQSLLRHPTAISSTTSPYPFDPPTISSSTLNPLDATNTKFSNHAVIKTRIEFDQIPKYDPIFDNITSTTFGDLHGNPLKFLHELVRVGVFKVKENHLNSRQDYSEIVQCVKKSHESSEWNDISYVERFEAAFDRLFEIKNPNIFIRLLGDMFCDRISNDLLMIRLLKILHSKIMEHHKQDLTYQPYEIILSNHDIHFIKFFIFNECTKETSTVDDFATQPDGQHHYRSFFRLKKIIEAIPEMKTICQNDFNTFYQPYLKLLSFDQGNTPENSIIFSHAMFFPSALNAFCKKYGVQVLPEHDLKIRINMANAKLQELLQENNIILSQELHECNLNEPIQFMAWIRTSSRCQLNPAAIPQNIHNIHGHDLATTPGRTTLDDSTGKCLQSQRYRRNALCLFENNFVHIHVTKSPNVDSV